MTDKPSGDEPELAQSADTTELTDPSIEDADFDRAEPRNDSTPKAPSRFAALIAFLALLIAVASAGAVGYVWWSGEKTDSTAAITAEVADLRAALARAQNEISSLERQAAEFRARGSGTEVDVGAIERRIEGRLRGRIDALGNLPARVASTEQAISALRGMSTGAKEAWLLAEAEYYMQIANAQLELAANPPLATLALKLADERLVELSDPGLTDVRRALAEEIQALEVLDRPDTEGTALTLAGLSAVADALPVKRDIVADDTDTRPAGEDLSGSERALASLKRALSGVVRVRRTEETVRPLLAPDAVYLLRANFDLQLQSARLALLRGEQTSFQQSLGDAETWLQEYYDIESAAVQSALGTLAEIRGSSFRQAMPDISQSLRLLRDYLAFVDAANEGAPQRSESSPPEPTTEPAPPNSETDTAPAIPEPETES